MWPDNETNRDFLNFRYVAETAAEVIHQANGTPLSLGVSGGWGSGKSSMVKLIADALAERGNGKFLFVEFNAWLYQGYDDARAALMEVIARALLQHGETTETGVDKAKKLLKRVNWLRVAGLTAASLAGMAVGVPPVGLIGAGYEAYKGLTDGDVTRHDVEVADAAGKKLVEEGKALIKDQAPATPPKEIESLRQQFKETLQEMDVTLVCLIDDLDRCLPSTSIATLEAIRLFLFMENTAFVIAADDKMIRHAVRAHFGGTHLDDELVTNYFDKLIQVPLRVPPLGTQDVRAYLSLLFIDNSELSSDLREELRKKICAQLSKTWQGARVDRAFVGELIDECPAGLKSELELADRLAPLLTTATKIAGNPRLIKRFLNTLKIRTAIGRRQNVNVDAAALAKMMLFERCGPADTYARLVQAINDDPDGRPTFIMDWERSSAAGEEVELPKEWSTEFIREWLLLPPTLGDLDLRPVVYVSRDHLPIITAADQLSPEAASLLAALLEVKSDTTALDTRISGLTKRDLGIVMDRLLDRARREQTWGTPPILHACLLVVRLHQEQSERLEAFLRLVPGPQLTASIVPLLGDKDWASNLLDDWHGADDTPAQVRRAIEAARKRG